MEKFVLGLVGPDDLVKRMVNSLNTTKIKNMDYKFFIIQQVEDTKQIDNSCFNECDLLFFAGQMAYEIYLEKRINEIDHDFPVPITIRYDGSALYKTLYELAIENQGSLASFTPFTIDVISEGDLCDSLGEIGLNQTDIIPVKGKTTFTTTNDWATIHENNYKQGKSKYALTCLTSVANELVKRNIPVKRVMPTRAAMNAALELLYAKAENLVNNDLQTAAILVKWHEPDRRPQNRYTFYRQKLQFEQIIIDFCEQHQASMVFINEYQANIYTNKWVLKKLTNKFRSFPLLKELSEKTGNKISVGIGIGDETAKAEHYAEKSLKFADSQKKPSAFVTFSNGNISGPLLNEDTTPLTFSTNLNNEHLKEISRNTNLSPVTISRFISLLEQNDTNQLTVHHLAEAFDISLRSASRLLKQLEESGLAETIGEEQPPGRGRPRKIYSLEKMVSALKE